MVTIKVETVAAYGLQKKMFSVLNTNQTFALNSVPFFSPWCTVLLTYAGVPWFSLPTRDGWDSPHGGLGCQAQVANSIAGGPRHRRVSGRQSPGHKKI